MKTILLIARDNSYGSNRDSMLLKSELEKCGHEVLTTVPPGRSLISWLSWKKHADVIIHFERIFPRWYSAGEQHFLIPNQERYPKRHLHRLKKVEAVLAKTAHADDIFSQLGSQTFRLRFTSEDRSGSEFKKNWQSFFHLAGGSTLKGTEALVELWNKHPEWPELILVQKTDNAPKKVPDNIKLHSGYMSDEELYRLQNECGIHLCPSLSEGWGHYIVEALSCGAYVLTTDAAPMNELIAAKIGKLIKYTHHEPRHLGTNFFVDRGKLEQAIEELIQTSQLDFEAYSKRSRQAFLDIHSEFQKQVQAFSDLLK